jgi:hypothetical protein
MSTQMTDTAVNATGARIAAAMHTGNQPLREAGWLTKLPAAEIENTTEQLVTGLSPGWRLRVADLMKKLNGWMEARSSETAASDTVSTLRERRSEAEREAEAGRARFRELLDQNSGTVTAEMKKLRAAYLEQEETARELESLTGEKEKQLPQLAHNTGCKANAYVLSHEGITDERVDELLGDFLVLHGAELFSLLNMKYRQFRRTGSEYMPGVMEGVNDADTLYDGFVMQRIAETGRKYSGLMFRDDVLSLTGIKPAGSAKADCKKKKLI